jgi:hypothetical protein
MVGYDLGMKFQFGIRTALLVITTIAIACGGVVYWTEWMVHHIGVPAKWTIVLESFGLTAPLWMPITFLAFAFGRKSLSWKLVVAFAAAEDVACGIFIYFR